MSRWDECVWPSDRDYADLQRPYDEPDDDEFAGAKFQPEPEVTEVCVCVTRQATSSESGAGGPGNECPF